MAAIIDTLTMKEAGRKFRAFLICVLAATIALVATTQVPALVPILPAYLTAIGGFLTVYLAGNVAHRHVTMKSNGSDPTGENLHPSLLDEELKVDS